MTIHSPTVTQKDARRIGSANSMSDLFTDARKKLRNISALQIKWAVRIGTVPPGD